MQDVYMVLVVGKLHAAWFLVQSGKNNTSEIKANVFYKDLYLQI